ncbi:MAG: NADH dehydrogenase (quinone) subunit D [Deltaproteobacteria bacterium CG2_30_63_29]|nr:MAG: NADH dehydrogenase (quinone) subunit D [Deltaproteobacteria bacterium CG2_30_63_29]PJB34746.1 MAG: NADH-quinone oxidoreductase subunit D [Deltaproteobacteria bacterium CG_4_9_14_3_um_filter_63_12]
MLEIDQDLHTEAMLLNMGPSHPATHGTVRFVLTLDGESILKCDTEIGYLHRGFEKMCESSTWTQVFPFTDRLNYVSPLINNFGYAMTVEKLLGLKVPIRTEYIRTILSEMSRMSDYLTCLAAGALELGGFTAFLYAVEGREFLWDLIEEVTGQRMMTNYGRIGGLKDDLTDGFAEKWKALAPHLRYLVDAVHKLLTRNRIFIDRMEGTGIISQAEAISYGFTGPCLRSTGVEYDVRKAFPYHAYDKVDFDLVVGSAGDNYDRYLVRMEEIIQSMRIIDQCLDQMEPGPINCDDPRVLLPPKSSVYNSIEGMINHFKLIFEGIQVPAGEVYGYVEGGNGELGYYIVSNGSGRPWKIKVRPPCFYLMGGMAKMVEGAMLADIIPTFDTINLIGGEIDR